MAKAKEKEVEVAETISAKAVAEKLGVDAKAFRRWLRRHTDNRAGKGGRWVFTPTEADELIAQYKKEPAAEEVAAD